jgi:hypothetical protein
VGTEPAEIHRTYQMGLPFPLEIVEQIADIGLNYSLERCLTVVISTMNQTIKGCDLMFSGLLCSINVIFIG